MLDIFKKDAFSTLSLTTAINKLPYTPTRIGDLGLFQKKGITTTQVAIEEQQGKLSLIMSAARGTIPTVLSRPARNIRSFAVPHLPVADEVRADEVQGVRAFGSEDQLETVAGIVNEKLAAMKANIDLTLEWHRVGALRGTILDGDGSSTIYNLFTEFGISQTSVDFNFTAGAQSMKTKAMEVIRAIEDALGAQTYQHIHAFCSNQFFDAFIAHAEVTKSYEQFQTNAFSREQQRQAFTWGDITWENYRGKIGSTSFIPDNEAVFFPVGVPNLFIEHYAPAPFIETVNTVGKPYYAKQEPTKFDMGVDLLGQSNPLVMCTRPKVLVRGY